MKPYRVINQQETQTRNPVGDLIRVVRVTAETVSGTQFSVEVARDNYNPALVEQMLDAEAENFMAVDSLGHS